MLEYYVVYGADGVVRWRASGNPGAAALQQLDEGLHTLVVPQAAIAGLDLDMDLVLAALKADRIVAVQALRDALIGGGYDVPGVGLLQTDEASKAKITSVAFLAFLQKTAGQPFSVDWILTDNSIVPLSADQIIAVGKAVAMREIAARGRANALKVAINAATSMAAVLAIDITAGWPA